MGRNIMIDARRGGGAPHEILFGEVTIEATALRQDGTKTVFPAPTTIGVSNGVAVLENVDVSPAGPEPAWAYRMTFRDHMSGRGWSEMVGVPTGTTAVKYPTLPRFTTAIPPETTKAELQNWVATTEAAKNTAVQAAATATAPTDAMVAGKINDPASLTGTALSAAIVELVTGPTYYSATNLIPVPDYAAFPNGWKYQGSGTGAVVGNTLTVTGTGAISGVGVYSDRAILRIPANHKVYVRAVVTSPTQAASYSVSLSNGAEHVYVNGTAASVRNPATGVPVAISAVLTIPAAWTPAQGVALYQVVYHANAAAASGVNASFAPPVVIDLTETYGAGEEPAKAHLDTLVGKLPQPMRTVVEFDKYLPKTPTYSIATRSQAGPPVILRFDDGYVNNLINAAPILEEYGMRGTLYMVTRPVEWAGAPLPMLSPVQILELHNKYRWEVGSHMTAHEDASQGDPYVWIEKLRTSCQDLLDAGLPWPRTFAYPNGSRNVVTDRGVYRLFNNAGLTGHPTLSPARRDAPTFFHRWTTINGLSPESGIEQAKAYVRESAAKGEVPILGFHGVTDGAPPALHHISKADLITIVGWLAAEGYSTITAGELMPHNTIMDPGFETRTFGYPWVTGAGWTRTRSTAAGHTGYYGADLATGGTGSLSQNVAAQAGTQYRVRVRIGAGSSVTGGTVTVRVQPQTPMGTAVGSPLAVGTVPVSVVAETDVTAIVTMPSGAGVAKLEVVPSAFTGAVRVTHAALYRADLHDPLA